MKIVVLLPFPGTQGCKNYIAVKFNEYWTRKSNAQIRNAHIKLNCYIVIFYLNYQFMFYCLNVLSPLTVNVRKFKMKKLTQLSKKPAMVRPCYLVTAAMWRSSGLPSTVSQELTQHTPLIPHVFTPGIFLCQPYTPEYALFVFHR